MGRFLSQPSWGQHETFHRKFCQTLSQHPEGQSELEEGGELNLRIKCLLSLISFQRGLFCIFLGVGFRGWRVQKERKNNEKKKNLHCFVSLKGGQQSINKAMSGSNTVRRCHLEQAKSYENGLLVLFHSCRNIGAMRKTDKPRQCKKSSLFWRKMTIDFLESFLLTPSQNCEIKSKFA